MNGESRRLPELTGLRAIASLLVVATHAAYWTGRYSADTIGLFWTRLDFGVALFFALSGFLLVRPWINALRQDRPDPSLRHYASRRFWRIVPAYWAVVLVGFALYDAPAVNGVAEFVRHLFLGQIYGDGHLRSGLTQTWSLATEVAFYIFLPFLGWFITGPVCRRRWLPGRIMGIFGLLVVINVAYLVFVHSREVTLSSQMWLPAFFSWFVAGMGLYVLVSAARDGRTWAQSCLSWPREAPLTVLGLALILFLAACTPLAGDPSMYQNSAGTAVFRNLVYASVAALILSVLVVDVDNPVKRALARLEKLGEISYEIFLVHILILEYVMHLLDQPVFTGSLWLTFTLTVVLSIPAAWGLKWVCDRVTVTATGVPAPH